MQLRCSLLLWCLSPSLSSSVCVVSSPSMSLPPLLRQTRPMHRRQTYRREHPNRILSPVYGRCIRIVCFLNSIVCSVSVSVLCHRSALCSWCLVGMELWNPTNGTGLTCLNNNTRTHTTHTKGGREKQQGVKGGQAKETTWQRELRLWSA